MNRHPHILAKIEKFGNTTLYEHLKMVDVAAQKIARHYQLDPELVHTGAVLHDIGKAHPTFQKRLGKAYDPMWEPFRHEIASLLFLPTIRAEYIKPVIEMIIAHHKSAINDIRGLGIIDLYERFECDGGELFTRYFNNFTEWSNIAFDILTDFDLKYCTFSEQKSQNLFYEAIDYCRQIQNGWSSWKGILMSADYLASALNSQTEFYSRSLFTIPDLSFYNRKSELYPLSFISTDSQKQHTMVSAPTGAGKTDFLLRRCKNRVFYTLPFQASINAMYKRIKQDLKNTNADIRLLHSTSKITIENGNKEERVLQGLIGASIKVMTPHQLASIVFGTRGYEMLLLDLRDNDIILDEIHTYTAISQAIVIELVKILNAVNCHIHIGTATMPLSLKNQILSILGENIELINLEPQVLDTFDRHIIHKIASFDSAHDIINRAIENNQKILIVANQVKRAQNIYHFLRESYPNLDKMLLHSRFKRADRTALEHRLKSDFDMQSKSCIVVSTQVVEVSLDISFDLMITECAPLDSLIQRFGRINRHRKNNANQKLKSVYVCAPPESESDALPYNLNIMQKSYDVLTNNIPLKERDIQSMLDSIYPQIDITPIQSHVIFKKGKWTLKKLVHRSKSVLMDLLDIESAVCICEGDQERFILGDKKNRISIEIPVSYKSIAFRNLRQLEQGNKPFVIPNSAYDNELGVNLSNASPLFYTDNFI